MYFDISIKKSRKSLPAIITINKEKNKHNSGGKKKVAILYILFLTILSYKFKKTEMFNIVKKIVTPNATPKASL